MKILMVNRYGYPGYGGENYFLNLCQLLKEKGHKVIIFTTKDERNIYREYTDYYVNKIDVDNLNSISLLDKMSYAPKIIYSFEAKQKIEKLIRDTQPDIVHIHNIKRLISPSILHSIKKFNIPIVYTLHDYHLICLNYRLFYQGKICEDCKDHKYYKAILKKCIRSSVLLSLLGCIEQYVHTILKIFEENVDIFITPSNFLRKKMIEYGFNPGKIIHLPCFVFMDNYLPNYEFSNYVVYIGRLVEEKGLNTLIKVMKKISEVKLLIIGDGTYRDDLEKAVINEKISNVEFKSYIPKENIKAFIKNSICVVVPSIWYDISPMVIYESFAMGKPVIGANIGGIPEVIDDGVNGLLFKPGDANELAEKIRYLLSNKDKLKEMGSNGRRKVLEYYCPEIHYEKILKVYQSSIAKR